MLKKESLKSYIEELVQEVEKELEEANVTGNVDGYQTPHAFSRKSDKERRKKNATQLGYSLVDNDVDNITEAASKEAMGIAAFTGTRGDAVQNFIDTNKLNSKKLFKFIEKGKLSDRMDLVTAIAGKPGNPIQKKMIKMFGESVTEGQKRFKRQDGIGKAKYTISYHDGKKKHKDGSDFFDIKIFNNKKDLSDFVGSLVKQGYKLTNESVNSINVDNISEAKLKPKKLTQLKKGEKFVFNNNPYEFVELYSDIPNAAKVKTQDGKTSVVSFGGGVVNKNTKGGFSDYLKQGGRVWDNVNISGESLNEAKIKRPVNRWLELKNDESMHANKKLATGLKELKYQLAEVEKFFTWYNKIKNINELDSDNYWKRTNTHIYKIKERLINIARTLQEIEK